MLPQPKVAEDPLAPFVAQLEPPDNPDAEPLGEQLPNTALARAAHVLQTRVRGRNAPDYDALSAEVGLERKSFTVHVQAAAETSLRHQAWRRQESELPDFSRHPRPSDKGLQGAMASLDGGCSWG